MLSQEKNALTNTKYCIRHLTWSLTSHSFCFKKFILTFLLWLASKKIFFGIEMENKISVLITSLSKVIRKDSNNFYNCQLIKIIMGKVKNYLNSAFKGSFYYNTEYAKMKICMHNQYIIRLKFLFKFFMAPCSMHFYRASDRFKIREI